MPELREWWTLAEFAKHYHISVQTVRNMVDAGELKAIQAGPRGARRISDAVRLAWEFSREVKPAVSTRSLPPIPALSPGELSARRRGWL